MKCNNYYDVTKWETGNPYEDIGEVINSMIADIKSRQTDSDVKEGGKPGAVIEKQIDSKKSFTETEQQKKVMAVMAFLLVKISEMFMTAIFMLFSRNGK